MDIFWTVVAGTAVYVLGQAAMKFLIEPWQDFRALVGRIAHALILYPIANSNPQLITPVPVEEARRELRSLSGELWQRTYAIPLYGLVSRICWWVPTVSEIGKAAGGLIGLSNSLDQPTLKHEYISEVRQGLHIHDVNARVVPRLPPGERMARLIRRRRIPTET